MYVGYKFCEQKGRYAFVHTLTVGTYMYLMCAVVLITRLNRDFNSRTLSLHHAIMV